MISVQNLKIILIQSQRNKLFSIKKLFTKTNYLYTLNHKKQTQKLKIRNTAIKKKHKKFSSNIFECIYKNSPTSKNQHKAN